MSLFKRVQNILEEDRKAYFSSKQTDLYEKVIKKKLGQTVSKQGSNILTKIGNTPFGRYIKKKYGKLLDNITLKKVIKKETKDKFVKKLRDIEGDPQSKEIRKQIEKETGQNTREFTQKSGVTKGNENKFSDKKITRPNVKNKKYRNKDGSFNQEMYDKDKASYKSFIETPKVDPKIETPKVDPKIETPKVDPSQISKLLKAARKNNYVKYGTVGALGAAALYNRFRPQSDSKTQTQTELQNNNNNNKKLTTTDNNNNNNKGIVTPPNNDKKIKLKPGIPIIYKFGLGVNDKKSK